MNKSYNLSMTNIDLIISPKWILTSSGDKPQKNLSIVISGSKIHEILCSDDAVRKYKTEKHLKLPNQILLPGLINPYSELSQQLTDQIISHCIQKGSGSNREKSLYNYCSYFAAKLTAIKLIKSGATSYTNVSYYPDVFIDVFSEVGIRLFCGLPMYCNNNPWSNNEEDSFKKNLAIYDKYKSYPNTQMFFCLFRNDPISQPMLNKLANVANELELPVILINDSILSQEKIQNIFEPLIELNLMNKNFTCINFPLNSYVLSLIKEYGMNIVLSDLQEKILTDKVRRNNISLFIEKYSTNMDMSLMRNIEQIYLRNKYNLTIPEISTIFFKIINRNAARVISRENNLGELEINKNADIISISFGGSDSIKGDIMNLNFFDSCLHNMIDNVWIAGKHICKNRKLVTINEHILYDEIDHINGST